MTDHITTTNEANVVPFEKRFIRVDGIPQRIAVTEIIPDPNQPRKTFHQLPMEELVAAAKVYGIMQSLTLRKKEGKLMIVHGERRWRAATKAGLPDVPAMIIEATDEQALAMQIVENLQREDVPLMEQAISFRQMAELCKMNVAEIALSAGKSEYFVRQQIKLTELTPKWQTMVTKQAISVKIALQIAVFPVEVQKLIYENEVSKEDEKAERPVIHLNSNSLTKYCGILTQAVFDITDTTLDTKMGACINCPFNSSCYSLFPDEEKQPRCNNIICFNTKSSAHIKREFEKAKDDPTIVLVYEAWNTPDEIKTMREEGLEIFKMGYSDDCTEMVKPRKQIPQDYEEWAKRQGMKKKDIKQAYAKAVKKFESDKTTYDKHVASGRYKKAFIVYVSHGNRTGMYTYVEMNSKKNKPTAKQAQQKLSSGKATIDDIQEELTRLKDREIRNKELDMQKVQTKIVDALRSSDNFNGSIPKTAGRVDNSLLTFLLFDNISSSAHSKIESMVKMPAFSYDNPDKFIQALDGLPKQKISFVLHQVFLDKYGSFLPGTKEAYMVRKMAESLGIVPIATFEKEQKVVADKRLLRIKEKITALNILEKKINGSSKAPSVKQIALKQKQAA